MECITRDHNSSCLASKEELAGSHIVYSHSNTSMFPKLTPSDFVLAQTCEYQKINELSKPDSELVTKETVLVTKGKSPSAAALALAQLGLTKRCQQPCTWQ